MTILKGILVAILGALIALDVEHMLIPSARYLIQYKKNKNNDEDEYQF